MNDVRTNKLGLTMWDRYHFRASYEGIPTLPLLTLPSTVEGQKAQTHRVKKSGGLTHEPSGSSCCAPVADTLLSIVVSVWMDSSTVFGVSMSPVHQLADAAYHARKKHR